MHMAAARLGYKSNMVSTGWANSGPLAAQELEPQEYQTE